MLEGEQYQACLNHVKRLEEKKPLRACLLATKALLLRVLEQWDEARANITSFLQQHPDNPIALSESALLTAITGSGVAALAPAQKALALSGKTLDSRVYVMLGAVADRLAIDGHYLASAR